MQILLNGVVGEGSAGEEGEGGVEGGGEVGGSLGDLVGGVDSGVVGGESGRGAELVVELGFEGEEFVAVGKDGEGGVVGGDGEELTEAADVLPLGEAGLFVEGGALLGVEDAGNGGPGLPAGVEKEAGG